MTDITTGQPQGLGLGGLTNAMSQPGYALPVIGTGSTAAAVAPQGVDSTPFGNDPAAQAAMTQHIFNTQYSEENDSNFAVRTGKFLAASGVDIADMAVGSLVPGVHRGDVWKGARAAGMDGLANFAQRNESGVALTSGLVGSIVTAGIADAYIAPALAARAASSTFLTSTKLWGLGEKVLGGAKAAATTSAMEAAVNGEMATVLSSAGGRALLTARVAQGVGKAAVAEGAVAAVTHSNSAVWSDDSATNLAFIALGLGIGAGLGGLGARFEARQIANDPAVVAKRASTMDPMQFAFLRENQPEKEMVDNLAGAEVKESMTTTSLALEARQQIPASAAGPAANRIRATNTQTENQMYESLQKISSKGVDGVSNTSFKIDLNDAKDSAVARQVVEGLRNDPTLLLGVDSIGKGKYSEVVDARNQHIENLMESEDVADLRKAQDLKTQTPNMIIGGTLMPDSMDARLMTQVEPRKVDLIPTTSAAGNYEFQFLTDAGAKVKVNEGGNIKGFGQMPINDRLQAVDGMVQLAQKFRQNSVTFILPKDPTWLQTDFALHLKSTGGNVDLLSKAGFKDTDAAEIHSFREKARDGLQIAKSKGGLDYWDRLKLNLPLPSSLERIHDGNGDALIQIMNSALSAPKMTALEAKQARAQVLSGIDLRNGVKTPESAINGDFFNFNRSKETGQWMEPVTAFQSFNRIDPEIIGTRDHLMIGLAENKIGKIHLMAGGDGTGLAGKITNALIPTEDFQVSSAIRGLDADQVTGLGGPVSQGLGTALTREMRYRNSETMLAALRVRAGVERIADLHLNDLIQNHMGNAHNALKATVARPSKALLDSFGSSAGGWDLKKVAVPTEGKWGFELADTPRNRSRLGRDIEENEVLTDQKTGRSVVVDEVGLDFLQRFQDVANNLLEDKNRIRAARGLDPISSRAWYVPPPNTKGKFIGFTLDANGVAVPGGGIVANSQAEFEALRRVKESELAPGNRFFAKAELESKPDLWDQAQMDWIDPGAGFKANKGQTGSLFGDQINSKWMEESMGWIGDQVRMITDGTVKNLYDSQLGIARARSAAMQAISNRGEYRSIWDEWQATILGKPLTTVVPGKGTEAIKALEGVSQSVINAVWPTIKHVGPSQLADWTNDLMNRVGVKKSGSFHSYNQLLDALGPHTPYASAKDYAEQTLRVSTPPEVKNIASQINRFTASVMLRWFEFPTAALNMVGIVTNMPSILRSASTPVMAGVDSLGQRVGVIDSYKILSQGFKDMLTHGKSADWEMMVKNGDTSQSVAELNKQLGLIDSQSGFKQVMMGDKTIQWTDGIPKNAADMKTFMKAKGVDGLLSLATDSTESMSRSWAHFIGLRLADANGLTGMDARHAFARNVANQAIANYNPLNKPELFQTSFGSMFGLFTSYSQSYNQRLFRWMEAGDYASVGRQLAMQSSLFGVTTVPGFNAIESIFHGSESNPDATLTDAIYAKYGPIVGSAIANGGIQQITKLFGGDGISINSRADANYRTPTMDPTKLMAGLGVLQSIGTGMMQMAQTLVDPSNPVSGRQVSEILARNMPNRALKGALTVMANGGQDIDKTGAVISETRDAFESMVRLLGLRSARQQGEIDAYYANSSLRRLEAGRMETLRATTRTAFRSGTAMDSVSIFNQFVKAGGSPANFSTWFKDQIRSADTTRGMKDRINSMKSPSSQLQAWRYDARD